MTETMRHDVAAIALDDLRPHPGNPKAHDEALLDSSLTEFGYIEPVVIDSRTNLLISGHGRRERLIALRDAGEPPPDGIIVDASTGAWMVPAITGWASKDDLHAEAALVALNRIGERGGWEDRALLTILDRINEEANPLLVAAAGFDDATIKVLRRAAAAEDIFGGVAGDDLLDEWKDISGQDQTDYKAEFTHRAVVYFRDNAAVDDFCSRLGLLEPLGRDLNYPLDWTPNDRRKTRAPLDD